MTSNFKTFFLVLLFGGCTLGFAQFEDPGEEEATESEEVVMPMTATPAEVATPSSAAEAGVLWVTATTQGWDFYRPWNKRNPSTNRFLGVALENGMVMVTASSLADVIFVELERAVDGQRSPAQVEVIDYEANLALLRPERASVLEGMATVSLASDASIGDFMQILQLESTGSLAVTPGRLAAAEVGAYVVDKVGFLLYRVAAPLQSRDGSTSLPVLNEQGQLVGLMMRYDTRSQALDLVAAPIIQHFLQDASDGVYQGFPRAGISYAALRDPQLRRFVGAEDVLGGILISKVQKGSSADLSGIQAGDVLLRVGDFEVSPEGNILDPTHGLLQVGYVFSTLGYVGDMLPLSILREGELRELSLELARRDPNDYNIPPYVVDTPPDYVVLGGLVLQELSGTYLREWGAGWEQRAPLEFVYLYENQEDLLEDPSERVVIFSQLLPSPLTLGYEDIPRNQVTHINGQRIRSLVDAAAAIQEPEGQFHKIEFAGEPGMLFLDVEQVQAIAPELQRVYGLPSLQRLDSQDAEDAPPSPAESEEAI